jgi:glycosyltransferase involved in cell wall biosynthesis
LANWQATVHHGLPRHLHQFNRNSGEYLAFLGRISPEKRLDRAIEIARQARRKLKVAAKVYPEERGYFQQTIEPLLDQTRSFVEFVGEVGGPDKDDFLGNAHALLFPIDWPEPFGLVMIEAMACGTPVIAWRCGSVPEVIDDGVTGFIVEDVDGAVRAVNRVAGLSRSICRATFEGRFDAARMAQEYMNVYQRIVQDRRQQLGPAPCKQSAIAI